MSFQRLHAPAEDGDWLAHPDPGVWSGLLNRNRELIDSSDAVIGGRPWTEWRSLVRGEIEGTTEKESFRDQSALVVSGHQPELFHPGVWIKNFAAIGFARSVGARALHVVTDNDLLKRTTIAVPGGTVESPLVAHLPFDQWTGEEPFEDRPVRSLEVFASLADRAAPFLANLRFETALPEFWRRAVECNGCLATRLSEPRVQFQKEWGADGEETMLSRFCRPEKRGYFLLAADILLRAEEYRHIYNEELIAYRRRRKLRSSHHPAPELETTADGVEVPYWAWKSSGRRYRPYVLRTNGRLRLSAGGETIFEAPNNTVEAMADSLAALAEWKIRPRALMTTTFIRLGLADLFIHGLGGAKYDEWNDAVIRRFWNIVPPAYAMITATLRLPIAEWSAEEATLRRDLERRRRDLYWNPERFIDDVLLERTPICDWVEEKSELCENIPTSKREKRARSKRFRELNERLREFVATAMLQINDEIDQANDEECARKLMGSREFFFGVHSAQSLRSFLLPWLDWSQPPRASRSRQASSL